MAILGSVVAPSTTFMAFCDAAHGATNRERIAPGASSGRGLEKLTELCKSGGVDVRDGPVFGGAVAPDLNGIAINDKRVRWGRALRGQGGDADEMIQPKLPE
jgi:hypothetical protein